MKKIKEFLQRENIRPITIGDVFLFTAEIAFCGAMIGFSLAGIILK